MKLLAINVSTNISNFINKEPYLLSSHCIVHAPIVTVLPAKLVHVCKHCIYIVLKNKDQIRKL